MLSERQEEILEKSIQLIAEKGIQGFTIKNLSKAIGISEPAIYRHFKSKTDILLKILDNFMQMANMLSSMMKENKMKSIEKISFMFNQMVETFTQNPAIVSVIFSEEIFKNEDILKNKIIEILNKNEETVELIIKTGQKNSEIRKDINEKTLSLMVMGSLRLLVKRWELGNYEINLKEEGKSLIDGIQTVLS